MLVKFLHADRNHDRGPLGEKKIAKFQNEKVLSRRSAIPTRETSMLLKITKPDGKVQTLRMNLELTGKPVTIGRDAEVKLDDAECSRVHCAIRSWDGMYIIRDMKSHNGTLVNGQKITLAELRPSDVISIGKTKISVEAEGGHTDVTVTGVKASDLKL